MRVRTSTVIRRTPEDLWPLLCDSRMDARRSCLFRLGVPKPVECRLPEGAGGEGSRRQCVSDRGVVHQRITCWDAPWRLKFSMEDTNLYFRPCVAEMHEEFVLEALGREETRITRTTKLRARGRCAVLKEWLLWPGLKAVHRYVFGNWRAGR